MATTSIRAMAALIVAVVLWTPAGAVAPGILESFESGERQGWGTFVSGDPPPQPTVLAGCASGSSCLQNVSFGPGPIMPRRQVVANTRDLSGTPDDWVGNYFEAGITALEVWMQNASAMPQTLYMRVGIASDAGTVRTCYATVNPVPMNVGPGLQVRFRLSEYNPPEQTLGLGLATDSSNCTGSASLQEVLTNVTELRIYSAAPSGGMAAGLWVPDELVSTLRVDNVRPVAKGQLNWRWVGKKRSDATPATDCPVAPAPWISGYLFGEIDSPDADFMANADLPVPLRQYCIYRLPDGTPASPGRTQQITALIGAGLSAANPDVLGVRPPDGTASRADAQQPGATPGPAPAPSSMPSTCPILGPLTGNAYRSIDVLEDTMYFRFAEHSERQAGRPDVAAGTRPYEPDGQRVRLAVIDSQPDEYCETDGGLSADPDQFGSVHGLTMMRLASWLACDGVAGVPDPNPIVERHNCPATVTGRVTLLARCTEDPSQPDDRPIESWNLEEDCFYPQRGGFTGLIAGLGRDIWDEVNAWYDPGATNRLLINGSLGWDPLFGGYQLDPADMPVPVQATYDALSDAACRGVVPIFAAGNIVDGPFSTGTDEAIFPARWEDRPGPDFAACKLLINDPVEDDLPTKSDYGPLVYAASGVETDDSPLVNARPGAEPRFVTFGDHLTVPLVAGTEYASITGSSGAAIVLSATVATAWHYRSELAPFEIMREVYNASTPIPGRNATLSLPGFPAQQVHRVRLCDVVETLCLGGACAGATIPGCPPTTLPASMDVETIEMALACPGCEQSMTLFPMTGASVASCPGVSVYEVTGEPAAQSKCPHLESFSASFRSATDPQPEDVICPMCTETARSPGELNIEVDSGFGRAQNLVNRALEPPSFVRERLTIDSPTLVCDDHVFNLPSAWFPGGFQAGVRIKLKDVRDICTNAERLSFVVRVGRGSLPATDPAPFDEHFSNASPVFRLIETDTDTDGDGIPDDADNCVVIANADQRDTDGDGFGNICDPDLDNSCQVNFVDLQIFKERIFSGDPDADFDGSGLVNFVDLQILKTFFFGTPGPAAAPNVCS